jgi:hypothetical protein
MTGMDGEATDVPDFRALHEQIQQHPGMLARRSWDALVDVHAAHMTNERELLAFIEAIQQNIDDMAVTMISNVGPQESQRNLFRELLRRLHNYVASAGTLIDHTRNLTRKYEGTPTHEEYVTRLGITTQQKVVPFVSKLRNFVLHVGVPAIGTQVRWDHESGETCLVFIDRDAALEWKDWPVAAREFLQAQPEKVPLTDVIREYGGTIEELYRWLYDQFTTLHGADIAEVNELIRQLRPRFMDEADPPPPEAP